MVATRTVQISTDDFRLLTALAQVGSSVPVNERGQLISERRALPGDPIRWLQLLGKGLVAGEDGSIIISPVGRDELTKRFPGDDIFRDKVTVRQFRCAPPPPAPPPDDPVARRAQLYMLKALHGCCATIDAYGHMRADGVTLPGRPDEWLGFAAKGWIAGAGGTLQVAELGRAALGTQWPDQPW
jgi:hypothetical protein